jgi:hypothetical protein
MSTNYVLESSSRELFSSVVRQRTKDNFFCLTDLMKIFEENRAIYGWSQNRIVDILSRDKAIERIYYSYSDTIFVNVCFHTFMEMCEKDGLVKVLKNFKLYQTTGKGENRIVYADAYIWMYCAMELNPMIYGKALKWITDTLILNRLEASDNYKPMNEAIKKALDIPKEKFYIYVNVAKSINNIVFGYHETGMRNKASKEDLSKVRDIEIFITNFANLGFLKEYEDLEVIFSKYKTKNKTT